MFQVLSMGHFYLMKLAKFHLLSFVFQCFDVQHRGVVSSSLKLSQRWVTIDVRVRLELLQHYLIVQSIFSSMIVCVGKIFIICYDVYTSILISQGILLEL